MLLFNYVSFLVFCYYYDTLRPCINNQSPGPPPFDLAPPPPFDLAPPPTSHDDSLVCFSGFLPPPLALSTSHHHQRVVVTRWWVSPAPMSSHTTTPSLLVRKSKSKTAPLSATGPVKQKKGSPATLFLF